MIVAFFIHLSSLSSPLLLRISPKTFAFIPILHMCLSSLNRSIYAVSRHILPCVAPLCKALHYSKTGVPWQMKSILSLFCFSLICPVLRGVLEILWFSLKWRNVVNHAQLEDLRSSSSRAGALPLRYKPCATRRPPVFFVAGWRTPSTLQAMRNSKTFGLLRRGLAPYKKRDNPSRLWASSHESCHLFFCMACSFRECSLRESNPQLSLRRTLLYPI